MQQPLLLKSLFNLTGAVSIGNALWMLFATSNWFNTLPAGLHDTGPLNGHFVRDLGIVYLLSGIALIWSAQNLSACFRIYLAVMLFYVGHALLHVVEILMGLLPPSHWLIDLPLVFLPALMLLLLTPSVQKMSA